MKTVSAHRLPAFAFGLLFAALGFTFAYATSNAGGSADRGASGDRAFGSACTRPPAEIITDSDLGVALIGTQFARQIIAVNGFKPYTFSFFNAPDQIKITSSGAINGTLMSPLEILAVSLVDASGGGAAKVFVLAGEDIATFPVPLHFVNGPILPDGVASAPYNFTIQVNGGLPPYQITAASSADVKAIPQGIFPGVDIPGEPILGSETLILTGKPIAPTNGPVKFTLVAYDSGGAKVSQTFSLTIRPGTITTDFLASSGTFKLGFGKGSSKDSLHLNILLNKSDLATSGIRSTSDLKGVPFSMTFGGAFLPPATSTSTSVGTSTTVSDSVGVFDQNGQIKFPAFGGLGSKDLSKFKITLNPSSGKLNVNFDNLRLISSLGADTIEFDHVIPVTIKIGAGANTSTNTSSGTSTSTSTSVDFDKTDVIEFTYRRSPNVGMGSANKNQKLAPAGIFIATKVTGSETRNGPGDDVTLDVRGFIRQPGGKPIVLKPSDTVQIIFGTNPEGCIGSFPASSMVASNEKLTFSNQDQSVPIRSLMIDNKKGTFEITTNKIAAGKIFNIDILTADIPFPMPITLTFASPDGTSTTFDGQTSATVFRKGTKLINK